MTAPSLGLRPLPPGFSVYWLWLDTGWLRLVAGGQGRPLVMVHGLGGSAEDFYGLAPLLAANYTCLLVDLPGFGYGAKPDAPYTPAFFAHALTRLAQTLGLTRPVWLGHSLGGQVVLWLAVHQPKLVDKVAAICPSGGHLGPLAWHRLLLALLTRGDRLRFFSPRLVPWAVAYVFGEPPWGPHSPACRELQQRCLGQWSGPQRAQVARAFIRAGRGLLEEPIWPEAERIQAPVLLVAGRGDHIVPRAWTDRLRLHLPPGSTYREVAGGHMPPYLAPEELAGVVGEFLA